MKIRGNFWDYLAWVCLSILTLWIILKMFGIINTPPLIEYGPMLTAVYMAGWAMHKLKVATEDIGILKVKTSDLEKDLRNVEKDIGIIKTNCSKC